VWESRLCDVHFALSYQNLHTCQGFFLCVLENTTYFESMKVSISIRHSLERVIENITLKAKADSVMWPNFMVAHDDIVSVLVFVKL